MEDRTERPTPASLPPTTSVEHVALRNKIMLLAYAADDSEIPNSNLFQSALEVCKVAINHINKSDRTTVANMQKEKYLQKRKESLEKELHTREAELEFLIDDYSDVDFSLFQQGGEQQPPTSTEEGQNMEESASI